MKHLQSTIIDNQLGRLFPKPALIGGTLFLILGVVGFFSGHMIGLFIALIGCFVCFTFSGIQINVEDRTVKPYTSFLGVKVGKEIDVSSFPFICMFKSNKYFETYSRSNRSTSYSTITYNIYLLNKTHREKILIKIESDEKQAMQIAKETAKQLNVDLVIYKPYVKSRENRR